ncbi:MAG: hypothetical protein AB7V06_27040 [Candidatus Obscuribacterales bacterium]
MIAAGATFDLASALNLARCSLQRVTGSRCSAVARLDAGLCFACGYISGSGNRSAGTCIDGRFDRACAVYCYRSFGSGLELCARSACHHIRIATGGSSDVSGCDYLVTAGSYSACLTFGDRAAMVGVLSGGNCLVVARRNRSGKVAGLTIGGVAGMLAGYLPIDFARCNCRAIVVAAIYGRS